VASIGSLVADLVLNSASFTSELSKAQAATARNTAAMTKSMAGIERGFVSAGRALKTFVVGYASIAGVKSLANLGISAIKAADEIAVAARKIGVSAEELQRWNFAADQADISAQELANAFKKFQANVATGKVKVEADSITGAFADTVKQIAAATTANEKMAIAIKAVGPKGAQTLLALSANAADFAKNLDEAFVTSEKLIGIGDALDDEWGKVSNALSAGFQTGVLQAFGQQLTLNHDSLAGLNRTAEQFGKFTVTAFGLGAVAIKGFFELLSGARDLWNGFIEIVSSTAPIWQRISAGAQLLASDISAVFSAVSGAVRAANDFITEMFSSAFAFVLSAAENVASGIAEAFNSVSGVVSGIGDIFSSVFGAVSETVTAVFETIKDATVKLVQQLGLPKEAFSALNTLAESFGRLTVSAFSIATNAAKLFLEVMSKAREVWDGLFATAQAAGAEAEKAAGGVSTVAKNIPVGAPGAFQGAAKPGAAKPGAKPPGGTPLGEGPDLVAKRKAEAEATKAASEAQRVYNQHVQAGISLVDQVATPLETYRQKLGDLQMALDAGKISSQEFFSAQVAGISQIAGEWLDVAATVTGALGSMFGDNKGWAIASAIINTAQAITRTFAQYGFTPIGIAAAAAQAAAGAAQIAVIKKQQAKGAFTGGSFMVRGAGGVDNNLVAMNLTRGERVDVTPAGAANAEVMRKVIDIPGWSPEKLYEGRVLQFLLDKIDVELRNGRRLGGRGRTVFAGT
jgi:hypothetical protein